MPGDPFLGMARRGLLTAAACSALSSVVSLPLRPARASEAGPVRPWPAGQATPALSLPAWQGPALSLAAARGRIVLLNFWASWCEPCLAEMPSLELLAARHAAQGLDVWAVNHRETDGAIDRFMARSGLSLPVLRDRDGAAARAFGVRIFPTTVVIGRDGRAAFSVVGETDWTGPQARQWVSALL
ncbi:MAG: TlpA family protein disulfide reductase [Burkholderiaceae bacterium]|nr:TlpA family protein disulfide reductase [Burkholderiaceae bacterium]